MGRGIVRERGASLLEALEDSCGFDSRDWERSWGEERRVGEGKVHREGGALRQSG